MPSNKTEATELSLAFGVLDVEPGGKEYAEISSLFENSLSLEKYERYKYEFLNSQNKNLYKRIFQIGKKLRNNVSYFQTLSSIRWTGPEKMASTTSMAKDIEAGVIPISVKAESDVVANMSPHNIFQALPSGEPPASRSENWYYQVAQNQYQELYNFVRENVELHLPSSIRAFDERADRAERKKLQDSIIRHKLIRTRGFSERYKALSYAVSSESANLFNDNLHRSNFTNTRTAVLENMAKTFFRLNSVMYYLAGIDQGNDFAVTIQDISNWKRKWEFVEIKAIPNLTANQPKCIISIKVLDKLNHSEYLLPYRVEIRWSHGRFCGNPEGKLYKEFAWKNVPFFTSII